MPKIASKSQLAEQKRPVSETGDGRIVERLLGCDVGASAKAGEQSKKTIVIEAVRTGDRAYSIRADGRNQKLVIAHNAGRQIWQLNRRGWTIPDLVDNVQRDSSVKGIAFDFPFSIPIVLLKCSDFAKKVGVQQFDNRHSWQTFVVSRTVLHFPDARCSAKLDLGVFSPWRNIEFWKKRATEKATGGHAALKYVNPSLFNMTILGASVLAVLEGAGVLTVLSPDQDCATKRWAIETYPGRVAKAVGFRESYKSEPKRCLLSAEKYLRDHSIKLAFSEEVRDFCLNYRTRNNDPDGADAFLCLVAAISFREGIAEWCPGEASEEVISEEGCIVVPKSA